jgi:mRNA-degrading endonuclease RelE of RelBE toxin-antitoxin system
MSSGEILNMQKFQIEGNLRDILTKLSVKDKVLYERVLKKIVEVVNSDDHYKNLRYDMKDYKRVHIGHFVLVFRYSDDCIYFTNLNHHDYIYK